MVDLRRMHLMPPGSDSVGINVFLIIIIVLSDCYCYHSYYCDNDCI